MPRVRKGAARRRKHKRVLKQARGYRGGRSKLYKSASEAIDHAMAYAYRGRKERKRDFRALWIARINARARQSGMSYSTFIHGLSEAGVLINRKFLSDIATNDNTNMLKIVSLYFHRHFLPIKRADLNASASLQGICGG